MQVSRSVIALALVGALAGACGGTPATQGPGGGDPTTGPGATQGSGPGATQGSGPGATQGGGGGGGAGDTSHGKVHIEITGPVTKTADYGFVPAGSIFGGDQGSSLNFTNEGTNEIVSIVISADGKVLVSYGTQEFSAPAAECTTSNWSIGTTSASGSFDCTAALVVLESGAMVQDGKIKGNFEARA